MPDFVVRFDDFDGGDYGNLDPARAKRNQYKGTNVLLYDSKLLGPRPGLKQWAVTGLPTHPIVPGPVGFDVWNDDLIVILDHPYRIDMDAVSPTATQIGTFSPVADSYTQFARAGGNLYCTTAGKLYKMGVSSVSSVALPAQEVELRSLCRFNAWLVGVDDAVPNRIYYSNVTIDAVFEFDNWPVSNFYDLPCDEPITALVPMFNRLYAGTAGGWFSIEGVLGERVTIRRITHGSGPTDDRSASVTSDRRILYWGTEPVPMFFNGGDWWMDDEFRVTGFRTVYGTDSVAASPYGRRLVMLGEDDETFDDDGAATEALMQTDRQWNKMAFDVALNGVAPHSIEAGYGIPAGIVFAVQRPTTIGDAVNIVTWDTELNRPGHVDDNWAAPYDYGSTVPVTGTVELPAWFDGENRDVRPRRIVIQFRKWPTGSDEDLNVVRCEVRSLGRYEGGATYVARPPAWAENADFAEAGGTDDRAEFSIDLPAGNGFQVVFPQLQGVAIRDVKVLCDIDPVRG